MFCACKNESQQEGEAPIFLRITYNKERIETRIKRKIDPVHWDQKKECSKKRSRIDIEVNEKTNIRYMTKKEFGFYYIC